MVKAKQFATKANRLRIVLHPSQISEVLKEKEHYVDLKHAAKLLGLKRTRVKQLLSDGVLSSDALPNWTRLKQWRIARDRVFELLDSIRRVSDNRAKEDVALISLSHILRYWRITPPEFCSLIISAANGRIPLITRGDGLMRDIAFCREQLRVWLHEQRANNEDLCTCTEAAKKLGLKPEVLYALVRNKLMVATIVPQRGRMVALISSADLEKFRQSFISLKDLACRAKTSPKALLSRLRARPVAGPTVDGNRQYFYRRADLMQFFVEDQKNDL
jgi:hypothetical protein